MNGLNDLLCGAENDNCDFIIHSTTAHNYKGESLSDHHTVCVLGSSVPERMKKRTFDKT